MNNDKFCANRDLSTRVGVAKELDGCERQRADYERFIQYMNEKAKSIGMTASHFNDAAGMNNISTARDLLKLAICVKQYPILDHIANTNLNRTRFKRHIFRINAPKSLAISAYYFTF